MIDGWHGGDSMTSSDRVTVLLDSLPDATAVVDPAGTIRAVNAAWRLFAVDNGGDPAATGVGISYLEVCARAAASGCREAELAARQLEAVLDGRSAHCAIEYRCSSPVDERWFLMRITPLAGPERGAVLSHMNITRRKVAERDLAFRAAHDPLTGLANRTLFTEQLAAALVRPAARGVRRDVGVLYADLDNFKPVNDLYGHETGDVVLQAVASRIREQVRPQDTVARLGGDEFAVVAPRITAEGLAGLTDRVFRALIVPHHANGRSVLVPASVGSHLAAMGDRVEDAIRSADRAMYEAKHGRPPPRRRSGGQAPPAGADRPGSGPLSSADADS